jgi:hypothetical protein
MVHNADSPIYSMDQFWRLYDRSIKDTNIKSYNIAIVTSTGFIKSYNRGSIQEITVDEIISGNKELEGDTIDLTDTISCFAYSTTDQYDRAIRTMLQVGVPFPGNKDTFDRNIQFTSSVNIMKKDHRYLLFFKEIAPSKGGEPVYKKGVSWFDLADTVSLPCVEREISVYSDNEIFTETQEYVDAYYQKKRDIFSYYGINT